MTITADMPSQTTAADEPPRRDGMLTRLVLGDGSQPRWVRPALLVLLVATAVLYLWALGSSGWANSYYAAAAHDDQLLGSLAREREITPYVWVHPDDER